MERVVKEVIISIGTGQQMTPNDFTVMYQVKKFQKDEPISNIILFLSEHNAGTAKINLLYGNK